MGCLSHLCRPWEYNGVTNASAFCHQEGECILLGGRDVNHIVTKSHSYINVSLDCGKVYVGEISVLWKYVIRIWSSQGGKDLEEVGSEIFFFFFFGHPSAYGVLGGSDPSHSFDLCHSCCNTRSFKPLCWAMDWTFILALQKHYWYHRATVRTPIWYFKMSLSYPDEEEKE